MSTVKRILVAALVVGLGLLTPSAARKAQAVEQQEIAVLYQYDLDATAITYCNLSGRTGDPFSGGIAGGSTLTTSGSSTTVTEGVASAAPFTPLSVGDVIAVDRGTGSQNVDLRVVTAKASGSSITVNSAVNWSAGYQFQWYKLNCGTSATSGWIDISGFTARTFVFQLEQVDVTGGIDVDFECKGGYPGAQPVRVFPGSSSNCAPGTLGTGVCNFTSTGLSGRMALSVSEAWGACRVGLLIHTSDDGADTTTHAEQITIGFIGQMLKR